MASQEDIELSTFRTHRSPDRHPTREGATSRPTSLSTTGQGSVSTEAGLAQESPSIFRGSDTTNHNTSEVMSSTSDKSPLISLKTAGSSEKHVRTTNGKRTAAFPWTLRQCSLLGLIAFLIALIVTLEVLHHFSNKNQGLVTADQDAAYLWKYLPTAILTILAVYWNKLDYHTKALMPWKLMSEKPRPADQSLLLDYVSGNPLSVLKGAIRHRHVPVITSTVGSLIIILVTVSSTGLFVLQSILLHGRTTVSVLSAFDGARFDSTAVDSFPVLAISSIFSGNLSIDYPPNTNADHAVDIFSLQNTLNGSDASKTGIVEAFQADLMCRNASVSSILATAGPYAWEVDIDVIDDGCETTFIATPGETSETDEPQLLSLGSTVVKQCPGTDQTKLFVLFGQLNISSLRDQNHMKYTVINSFNHTVMVCTPSHALQEALVTTDSAGNLRSVEVQRTSNNTITLHPDLLDAFNTAIQVAEPTFLGGPFTREYNHGSVSYDGLSAILLATWSRPSAEYLEYDTLMEDLRRFYRATASQIANRFLRVNSARTASGSYETIHLRVILGGTAFRITETGLAILIICACLMTFFPPYPSLPITGTTLASMAVTIQKSDQLRPRLCGSGRMLLERIKGNLSGYLFSSNGRSISVQHPGSETTSPSSATAAASLATWWRPVAFSIYMEIVLLTLPLTIVGCLEATYQVSRREIGLDDVPSYRYGHYAWTWIPASIMTSVSLLYSSLTWSVVLLASYSILRTRSSVTQHTLCQSNLSKASIQLTFQGLRFKRYVLLAVSISALLAPLLTIVVSGLIYIQPTRKIEDIVIPLADHILSPAGKDTGLQDWSQGSLCAANLLYQGYGSYPKGTYGGFVFPNLESGTDNITVPTGSKLLSASSMDVNVDVILCNTTCKVIDPASFRYTVSLYDSNDSEDTGNSWLNFTYIDLASLGCSDPSLHCDKRIASIGTELQAKSARFSSQAYWNPSNWADPSAWPNNGMLRQAIAVRNETTYVSPDLTLYYGTWNTTSVELHGIACYYDIRKGRATITYDLSAQDVISVQPAEETFVALANYSQALPWTGSYMRHLEGLLPNGDLWKTATNNTPEAFYDTPTGSDQLATQVSYLYNQFFTQFYNTALRSQNFSAGILDYANATLIDDNHQRIFQSVISTRILQVLLLAMWLCACVVYWLFDVKTLLPKNPCSIAAQASLLADSKFLNMIPDGADNATLEELMEMTPFKDHLFSMGWWDDGNGGRRFGIDVGMADFDKGEDDGEKVEESEGGGGGVEEVEEGLIGKTNTRVSVDIVGSRV